MLLIRSGIIFIGLFSKFIKIDARKPRKLFSTVNIRSKMESNEEIENTFKRLIAEHKVVVFSKTTCPFCIKVKDLFRSLNEEILPFELNIYPDEKCAQMQDVLKSITGQRTVPNVFIHGRHIGGCTDTQQALADTTIFDLLDGTYQAHQYDYVVIGGGSGGLASSKEAASFNRKVAVCDLVQPSPLGTSWGLGGTCVNVGCIPKKLMHKAAIIGQDMEDATHFGWTAHNQEHNWKSMVEKIQEYIISLNCKYAKGLKDANVTYYNAYGKFRDLHTLDLYNQDGTLQTTITSHNFLLAMGCRPSYPSFPGAREHCISSDDIFSMTEHPGKTLVIGASYIALETAGFLAGLGIDVTVMVRSILLRGFDQEIANMIGQNMEEHGVKFIKNSVPESVERISNDSLKVVFKCIETGAISEEVFKTVFLAVGREACTRGMGLEEIGVQLNEKDSRVATNNVSQSSVRNIFAVGDVIEEKYQLTPVAIQAGKLLAQRLYGKKTTLFDYNMVPTTVFTPLEYGCIGLSEEAAYSTYGKENIEVYHLHFQPLEWELPNRNKNKSFAKLVCYKIEQERVIGFHYLGPNAGEVTQGFALALKLGAKKDDFNNLIGIHPTCAEIFVGMTITKSSGKSADAKGC